MNDILDKERREWEEKHPDRDFDQHIESLVDEAREPEDEPEPDPDYC